MILNVICSSSGTYILQTYQVLALMIFWKLIFQQVIVDLMALYMAHCNVFGAARKLLFAKNFQ